MRFRDVILAVAVLALVAPQARAIVLYSSADRNTAGIQMICWDLRVEPAPLPAAPAGRGGRGAGRGAAPAVPGIPQPEPSVPSWGRA